MKNTLINNNVLTEYLEKYKDAIKSFIEERDWEKILNEWKEGIKSKKFRKGKEKQEYPYFMQHFLIELLGYEFETDWNFEDSQFTRTGFEEFTIHDGNDPPKPLLFIELKDQDTILNKKQGNNLTPLRQALLYASENSVEWYIVSNYDELRIYNKNEQNPRGFEERVLLFKFSELNLEDLRILVLLLAKPFFKEKQLISEIKQKASDIEKKITFEIYEIYHETLLLMIKQIQEYNEGYDKSKTIELCQLIMNRIIFICFAEDKTLLPNNILKKVINVHIEQRTLVPFKNIADLLERPQRYCLIWQNLNGLFADMNEGNNTRDIPFYNGKLFEQDISDVLLPDLFESDTKLKSSISQKIKKDSIFTKKESGFLNPIFVNFLALASFDFNTDVSVNILGHIFEQSLTDLEVLQEELHHEESEEPSQRKLEGIFYTPEFITDYICQSTIFQYLRNPRIEKRFLPNISIQDIIDEYNDEELDIIEDKVNTIKILDLACGSGAFLNKAISILLSAHKALFDRRNQQTKEFAELDAKKSSRKIGKPITGTKTFAKLEHFDSVETRRKIVIDNIFGVDINQESVGITKLSIFLGIAIKQKPLPTLDNNVKHGNSLISDDLGDLEDELVKQKIIPFDWDVEFKEIMDQGGFDIIIGNPPYVRRELISEIKPYLERRYDVYMSDADLYCYFFERALSLLKIGGYLGFIASNKWMKRQYGKNLRILLKNFEIREIIDFFELPVFTGASAEPAIMIIRNRWIPSLLESFVSPPIDKQICVTQVKSRDFEDLLSFIENSSFFYDRDKLDNEVGWSFTSNTIAENILERLKKEAKDYDGTEMNLEKYLQNYCDNADIKMGLKTGCVNAYRIDKEKYNELCNLDAKSKEIIKPLIQGTSIESYHVYPEDVSIILAKIGTNLDDYHTLSLTK